MLPSHADLEAWLQGYAAIGDACALGRNKDLTLGAERERSLEELRDLHWIYVENRLSPYFAEVNRILRELPTEVLLGSRALRRFVTSGGVSGQSQVAALRALPVPSRFLGPLVPLSPEKQDLAEAVRLLRRARSVPGLERAAAAGSGSEGGPAARPQGGGIALPRLRAGA